MRILIAASGLLLFTSPAFAHDFWLQPESFKAAVDRPLAVTFQVGHGKDRQRWRVDLSRVVALAGYSDGVRKDRKADLRSGGAADLVTSFATPGLHVLAMRSSYAFSELPARRFTEFAEEEGLVRVLEWRRRSGKSDTAGRERYSRRAKALIKVGTLTPANQAIATRPVGLKLEIVPDRNPYALDKTGVLPVHVLYNGRRLANATVKLTSLEFDARPHATAVTDANGRVSFRIPQRGSWLVNVVWSVPVRGDPKVDFDTTFSSLTFGYERKR
ncbi:DUF4198 domain-containing protein [Blastomonas sp.]|uniref:DUF4198 domain-containing protein n=1 Tax=Blastomonas sp. TaxID=1909299 RepID=UPI003594422A